MERTIPKRIWVESPCTWNYFECEEDIRSGLWLRTYSWRHVGSECLCACVLFFDNFRMSERERQVVQRRMWTLFPWDPNCKAGLSCIQSQPYETCVTFQALLSWKWSLSKVSASDWASGVLPRVLHPSWLTLPVLPPVPGLGGAGCGRLELGGLGIHGGAGAFWKLSGARPFGRLGSLSINVAMVCNTNYSWFVFENPARWRWKVW